MASSSMSSGIKLNVRRALVLLKSRSRKRKQSYGKKKYKQLLVKKRRDTLFRKSRELAIKSDALVCVICIDSIGKIDVFPDPMEAVAIVNMYTNARAQIKNKCQITKEGRNSGDMIRWKAEKKKSVAFTELLNLLDSKLAVLDKRIQIVSSNATNSCNEFGGPSFTDSFYQHQPSSPLLDDIIRFASSDIPLPEWNNPINVGVSDDMMAFDFSDIPLFEWDNRSRSEMRITLDTFETDSERRRSLTPKEEVQWVPLQKHPVFTATKATLDGGSYFRNLVAYDGTSRLYVWDSCSNCLHRLSLRLGEPHPSSVLAASPSKVLQSDVELNFAVHQISLNKNGLALLICGSERLCIMYLYGRSSKRDESLICRTVTVGSQTYSSGSHDIHVLKALWHPYSDTHLGILSSDSAFRIFNMASDHLQPEQEYYLQPVEPGRSRNVSSMCPVDFCFGGDLLWDRFSVFILFSDGAIYILCPVVPFGSVVKWESLLEIYNDARTFGLNSPNPAAASNSKLAISWLETIFPVLQYQETESSSLPAPKAQAYAIFEASLVLQGPLQRVGQDGNENLPRHSTECGGRAVSLLYNLVSKDSILVTAWSGGQLQIDALADEIQPVWSVGSPPRLRVGLDEDILGLAMICESITCGHTEKLDHTVWLGRSPPLSGLAIVDLALPTRVESGYNIALFSDPLMPESIYSLHDGRIDSVQFLPFTSQVTGKDDTVRTPSVHPVLSTFQAGCTSASPLCGFVLISGSFGYSWVVAVTFSLECIVLEMKTWNLLPPISVMDKPIQLEMEESKERDILPIISKELLSGPKVVLIPEASPSLRSVAADSIEGRTTLHQYFKLFHETYVEYAHKVYLEIKTRASQLKKIIDEQHAGLGEAQKKLMKVEEKQSIVKERINNAIRRHSSLEECLQRLINLPGAHKKPLSRAEQQFKSKLDHYKEVELDALLSSVEALRARLRRHMEVSKASKQQKLISGKNKYTGDAQISMIQSSLEKLSLVNNENSKSVNLVESALKNQESSKESSLTTR